MESQHRRSSKRRESGTTKKQPDPLWLLKEKAGDEETKRVRRFEGDNIDDERDQTPVMMEPRGSRRADFQAFNDMLQD